MILHLTKALIVLGLVVAALPSRAQILLPQDRGYVGLLAGYTSTSGGGISGRFGFGAEGGLAFTNGFTGLLYFQSSSKSEDAGKVQIDHYGAGLDYRLENV